VQRSGYLIAAVLSAVLLGFPVGIVMLVASGQQCGAGAAGSFAQGTQSQAQVVRYLESQGFTAIAGAGIVGNLQQESGLNPGETGGGLAQWGGSRYSAMVSWVAGRGMSPSSMGGQLEYLVFEIRSRYPQLVSQLNSATSPEQAATMFETTYELCSGVVGYMIVIPGSLCNDTNRRSYAAAAYQAAGGGQAGTAVPVSLGAAAGGGGGGGGGGCAAGQQVAYNGGKDPIPGFTPSRDDAGVDACAKPGMPIFAPATSVLIQPILPGWYAGQPLMLLKFVPPLAGTYQGDEYWYVAEQIVPASQTVGTVFPAGQPVASYASSGTCIETGWGSPTTNMRALSPGDYNPPAGQLTPVAESFKRYFGIPWVGQSP